MKKWESDIGLRAPPFCNDSPVRAEAKCEITVAVENRPSKPPLLYQIADNEEKKGLVGRNSACRVVVKVAQYAEPSSPIGRC
jgi:hypothetical protein